MAETHVIDVPYAGSGVDVVPQQADNVLLGGGDNVQGAAAEGPLLGVIARWGLAEDAACVFISRSDSTVLLGRDDAWGEGRRGRGAFSIDSGGVG